MRRAAVDFARQSWDAIVAIQMPMAQYALSMPANARILDVDTALSYQLMERYRSATPHLARLAAWASWRKAYHYERRIVRRFDAACVVSRLELASLRDWGSAGSCSVELVPNGVDCTRNHPGLASPQPNHLVYNGSLTYSANYDAMHWFLSEIYPLIKPQQPDVRLTITGSTEGVDLAGLALDAGVRLTGYVEDIRLPVAESTVAIAPIRQGGGTRLKILEAMALGTPVVATTKGAEGLDVIDGEHILLADTPQAFAKAVVELLTNGETRARLARQARRLVETQYDWREIGAQFVALVERTVADRRTPLY